MSTWGNKCSRIDSCDSNWVNFCELHYSKVKSIALCTQLQLVLFTKWSENMWGVNEKFMPILVKGSNENTHLPCMCSCFPLCLSIVPMKGMATFAKVTPFYSAEDLFYLLLCQQKQSRHWPSVFVYTYSVKSPLVKQITPTAAVVLNKCAFHTPVRRSVAKCSLSSTHCNSTRRSPVKVPVAVWVSNWHCSTLHYLTTCLPDLTSWLVIEDQWHKLSDVQIHSRIFAPEEVFVTAGVKYF